MNQHAALQSPLGVLRLFYANHLVHEAHDLLTLLSDTLVLDACIMEVLPRWLVSFRAGSSLLPVANVNISSWDTELPQAVRGC